MNARTAAVRCLAAAGVILAAVFSSQSVAYDWFRYGTQNYSSAMSWASTMTTTCNVASNTAGRSYQTEYLTGYPVQTGNVIDQSLDVKFSIIDPRGFEGQFNDQGPIYVCKNLGGAQVYTGTVFTCVAPYSFNGNLSNPQCIMSQCQVGYSMVNGSCVADCPTAGTSYGSSSTAFAAAGTEQYVPGVQGKMCKVVGTGGCVTAEVGSVVSTGCEGWQYTGESSSESPQSPSSSLPLSTAGNYSAAPSTAGCGTFNGDVVCLSTAPPVNTCVTSAAGNIFCSVSAQPGTAPPQPSQKSYTGSGSSTTPATPEATLSGGANATGFGAGGSGVNMYGPKNGTVTGGTTGGVTGGTTGGTTGGSTGGDTGGTCTGKEGDPCSVKIDEDGTPEDVPDDVDTSKDKMTPDYADAQSKITQSANDARSAMQSLARSVFDQFKSLIPTGGSCQSLNVTFIRGTSFQFPGAFVCGYLDTIKSALGWLMMLYVLFVVIMGFVRRA